MQCILPEQVCALPFRSPSSWSLEELHGCIIVWDQDGQALVYVYFEDDPVRRSAAKLLTRDEARRIAANIIKLPDLLQRPAGAMNDNVLTICERVAEVQALLHDHIECGKHTAADVVARAQAVLSQPEMLRAMFDLGHIATNTPPDE